MLSGSVIWTRDEAKAALMGLNGRKLPKGLLAALVSGGVDGSIQTKAASVFERFVDTPENDDVEDDFEAFWNILSSNGSKGITLTSIELQNFLIFRHTVINTRFDPVKPVVIIEGKNGYGKSSIIKAVRFVLAKEAESDGVAHFVHKSSPGNQVDAKVILSFTGATGDFDVRRVRSYRRSSGTWAPTGEDHLVVNSKSAALHGEDAEKWIAEHFPERLLNYYVFDAESKIVSELAGQKGTELPPVKAALETALNITFLRKTAEVCLNLSKEKSSTISKTYRENKKQRNKKLELDQKVNDLEAEIEEVSGEVRELERELVRADTEVSRYRDKAQPELQTRRENLLKEQERFSAKVSQADKQRKHALVESLPLALLGVAVPHPTISAPTGKSPEWRRGAEEASKNIADLISSGSFSWANNTPPAEEVARVLREAIGLVQEVDANRDRKREALTSIHSTAVRAGVELREWLDSDRLSLLQERLGDITRELKETPTPHDTQKWHDEHVKASNQRNSVARLLEERRKTLRDLRGDKTIYADHHAEGFEPLLNGSELGRLRRYQTMSETASETLVSFADELLSQRIKQLEQDASTMLIRTAHKHTVLNEIRVDPKTYRYAVFDRNGNPAPAGRSTGEKNLLALCLVHAIRKVAGPGLPLVVEAPLRVLDPVHRSSVLREILCLYPDQMILLLTPDEIPAELAPEIRDRVSRKLSLMRDGSEDEEASKIVETTI
jgi:DNA sulfur modification protein DndD